MYTHSTATWQHNQRCMYGFSTKVATNKGRGFFSQREQFGRDLRLVHIYPLCTFTFQLWCIWSIRGDAPCTVLLVAHSPFDLERSTQDEYVSHDCTNNWSDCAALELSMRPISVTMHFLLSRSLILLLCCKLAGSYCKLYVVLLVICHYINSFSGWRMWKINKEW